LRGTRCDLPLEIRKVRAWLEDIEDDTGAHLMRIEHAVEDEADNFAESAEWWALRQAKLPMIWQRRVRPIHPLRPEQSSMAAADYR
jgi:hypothetical protein